MGHKCFISFKTEDENYKKIILEELDIDMVDKSLDDEIDSEDEDYILSRIREDYLADSTVTIHLIGSYSAENRGSEEQKYIKRELQASLYDGEGNTRSGILGIVLPSMYATILTGPYVCSVCQKEHNGVHLNDATTVKEFKYNYYLPNGGKCCHVEEERYCVLTRWDDFYNDPEKYIQQAFNKKTDPIASKVKVYPE